MRTYDMEYTCLNCGSKQTEQIRQGNKPNNHRTKCKYCGISGHGGAAFGSFVAKKPNIERMKEKGAVAIDPLGVEP